MSSTMNLALQLTAIDMMSGIVARARASVISLGDAGKEVKRDFDQMHESIEKGLKYMAGSAYVLSKFKPGVAAAGDLQEAMLKVKSNIASGVKDAEDLNRQLSLVKRTAADISQDAPFSATDVVNIQNALLKAGLSLQDVTSKGGAAWSATALSTLSGLDPAEVGDNLARIGSQFRIDGGGYRDLSDWLVRVDDATATSVPELVTGLRMAGGNAAALGVSAKDTLTTLGALASLGDRAGSSLNNFFVGLLGLGKQQRALMAQYGLNMFKGGKFVGMDSAIGQLREKFGAIKDDQERLRVLIKIFGEEGGRAANEFMQSAKGFREIEDSAGKALSIEKKMSVWSEGFKASMTKLGGTSQTTLANLFNPLLDVLTPISDGLNNIVGKVGELAEKHSTITGLATGMVGLAAAGAGLYGLGNIGYGGYKGAKVWKGIGGLKGLLGGGVGLAAGIAKGKAIEAATGVTPVFVTNWPVGVGNIGGAYSPLQGGAPGAGPLTSGGIAEAVANKAAPGWLAKYLPTLGKGGAAAGLGTTALAVAGAGAAGYGAGRLAGENIGWGGASLDEHVQNLFARIFLSREEQKTYFEPTINVQVQDGKAVVEYKGDGASKAKVKVKRSSFAGME